MAAAERRAEELKGQEQTALAGGVRMSLDRDEEKAAKSKRLAEALGTQDTAFVERNFDHLNRFAESRRLYEKLDRGSVTRDMLVNGENLDDAENLAKVEDDTSYLGKIGQKFDKGRAVADGGRALFSLMWDDDADYDTRAAQYRDAVSSQPDEGMNWFARIPTDTAEMIGMYSGVLPDAGMAAAYSGSGGFMAGGPPAAISAGAAGLAIGSSKEIFEIEAGWAFDEYRGLKDATGQPVSRDAARGAALLVGGINAGLEFTGLSKIPGVRSLFGLLRVAGKGGVREILRRPELAKSLAEISYSYTLGAASEGLTEAMQEITVEMGKFALQGALPTREELSAVGERAWEAGQVGLRAALGLGAPATVVRTGEAVSENRKAKQMQEVFEALGQDVQSSKLHSRAPEQFQAFIRQVQERHGLVDTLYMDREAATTLFQEMVDIEAMMPKTFQELQEAEATDSYVAIPLDEFVTHVAPSSRLGEVMQDITFDPLEATPRQQEAAQAEAKATLEEYQAQMGEIDKAEDPLYGQVYTELLAAGRRAEVAEMEATLFTAGIRRMAERQGMDPLQYYREQNISIRGEVVEQEGVDVPTYTGGLLNLLREGRGPQQRDVFGESLVEFLISAGGISEPEGGELSARDLDRQLTQYGRRRLAREQGLSMEEAFERARDAGYLERGEFASEEQALLDAIDREIRGEAIYSPTNLSPQMQELQSSLDSLQQELDAQQIDLSAMSNEEVLERIGITEMEQPEQIQTPEFKAWFGDSKVVDAAGNPLVVYHGTPDGRFLQSDGMFMSMSDRFGEQRGVGAFWFAKDRSTASSYADDRRAWDYQNAEPEVIPAYLKLENPLIVEGAGKEWREAQAIGKTTDVIEKAQADGHDGVIIRNVRDNYNNGPRTRATDTYVVFDSSQIKSATSNRGTFDPGSGNIFHQLAYHGTPHRFDKFSLEKIGTGEGAQAFGWGLYFAGKKEVAEYYRDALSQKVTVDGNVLLDGNRQGSWSTGNEDVDDAIIAARGDIDEAIRDQREWVEEYSASANMKPDTLAAEQEILRALEQIKADGTLQIEGEGNLYEAEIPEDSEMLLWDAPLRDQPPAVQQALRQLASDMPPGSITAEQLGPLEAGNTTGAALVHGLTTDLGSPRAASMALKAAGIPGHRYLDDLSRGKADGQTYNYVVYDDSRVQVRDILMQREGRQKARGYLVVRASDFTITLTRNANLSTFVHESGHLYLELMKRAALADDVPADIAADWEIIKQYLGSDGDLTTEQHEVFARSFEAYLMEGKAPSQELRGVFSRFKAWMISVYRQLRNLDVELTDEIRGVFDRLLASEQSIQQAQQDIVPAFSETSGLSEAEYAELVKLQQAAIQAGEDEMLAAAQREIKRMRSDAYRQRRQNLTEEITAEVNAQPVYSVQRLLRTGNDEQIAVPDHLLGRRMSSQAITDMFADPKVNRRLVGLVARERGVHPDVLADLYGFDSGYQMVQQIIAAPPRSQVIKERVQAKLDEEFGNMAQDTDTVEQAALALRNNQMATFLVAEARALHRRLGTPERATLNQATKEAARAHVRSLALRGIRPHKFYQAELKAARLAQEAVAAEDYAAALEHKRRQLLNHHLYREAQAAVTRSETIRGKLKKFESPKYMARIRKGDPAAANAIDALLAGVEFKRTPLSKIDARRRVLEYVQAAMDAGEPVHVDPALYAGAELTNWREMTLEQLEQLDSSVQALAKQGREADKVRVEGQMVEAQELIAELDAIASENMTREKIDRYSVDHRSPITKLFTSYLASLRKIEFECRFADGDIAGKWHRAIFQPFVDAQNAKEAMLHDSVVKLKEIMGSIDRQHAKRLSENIDFLGTKMTRADLYVVVLNMGNQGNWDRLFSRRWKGREDAVLKRLQEELTLDDFRRIEALGQMIDTFYEPMAEVSERVDGIRPPKVEPKPLYLDRHGVTLSGWYYPVKYQDSVGTREQAVLEEANSVDMGPSPITGQVSKSMTKERMSGSGGVLSLDLAGLPQHLHQVVHYVTHYEAVRNFDKLRRKEQFRAMYEAYFGLEGYKQLRSWLQNIAANGTLAETSHDATKTMDSIFRRARYGGSLLGLGWKVTSAGMQALGLGPAAKEVGAARVARWTLKLAYGRASTAGQARVHPDYQRALDGSPELQYLDKQIDRDVREFTDRTVEVMKRNPIIAQSQWLMDNAYYMLIAVQKQINAVTWLAAYEKAQEEGRTVQESQQYADATVRQTQSGGGLKDLAGLQQGNELTKLVTLFYSYFAVQHNQLRLTGRQDLLRGFWRGEGPNGRLKSLQKFAAANFWIVLAPSIVEALLRGDDEDKEDMAPFLAERIGSTYVAGLPIFRDIYRAATMDFAMPSTPMDQVVQSLVKGAGSVVDIATLEGDWTDFRNIAKAATLVTWLPFYQVQMYTEALAAADDAGEALRNVFFGTPYSERRELNE